jgi:uncharacterized membrane protein
MNNSSEDKTAAVVSYLTLLGWILAYLIYGKNKTEFGAFHLRQSLGLHLTILLLLLFGIVGRILIVLVFIFLIIGFIYAIQGEKKTVPLIGDFFQAILKGLN